MSATEKVDRDFIELLHEATSPIFRPMYILRRLISPTTPGNKGYNAEQF